jgi:hypothetical protein
LVTSPYEPISKPIPGKPQLVFGRLSGPFLERVKYVHSLAEISRVEYPVLGLCANSDLSHAWTNGGHWLPIVRVKSLLNSAELKAGDATGISRESFHIAREELSQRIGLSGMSQYASISMSCQAHRRECRLTPRWSRQSARLGFVV